MPVPSIGDRGDKGSALRQTTKQTKRLRGDWGSALSLPALFDIPTKSALTFFTKCMISVESDFRKSFYFTDHHLLDAENILRDTLSCLTVPKSTHTLPFLI